MVAAFAVHVLTACGAACALLALIAAVLAEWARMFLWLGLALIIDGVDGTLARRLRVAELVPRWSGELLDFVVDFPTYVFVPGPTPWPPAGCWRHRRRLRSASSSRRPGRSISPTGA